MDRPPAKKFLTPLDPFVFIVLVGLTFSPLLGSPKSGTLSAVVRDQTGSETFLRLRSNEVVTFDGPLGETVIEVQEGKARVVSSPCPRKLCLSAGWLSRPGASAVCLPNLVAVTIKGDHESTEGVDGVSR